VGDYRRPRNNKKEIILMGFFSWRAQDTGRSIPNMYSSKETFPVVLHDHKGNKWVEPCYEGYGEFGGKDYYELIDEMNGGVGDRLRGINISCGVKAVRNKETNQVFRGQGVDFFNWETEKLVDGKSANELLDTDEWEDITITNEDTKHPNITETEDWEWRNVPPEDCEFQGYFYEGEDEN
jgi:hypothetical protein